MLERSAVRDREHSGRVPAVLRSERGDELLRGPDVERALSAVAVRVERRREAALGGPQLGEQPVAGFFRDPARQRAAGAPPQVRVHAGEQRVVVQHLLEVRYDPAGVDAVPGEAARQLVVHSAPGHRAGRRLGHGQGLVAARTGPALGVPEQELQHHRRRKLRCAAEPASCGVKLTGQQRHGGLAPGRERARRIRSGRAGLTCRSRLTRSGRFSRCTRLRAPGLITGARSGGGGRGVRRPGPFGQRRRDLAGLLRHLRPVLLPGARDAEDEPLELSAREIGAAEERLPFRRHEDGHRPAALAGHRLRSRHVDAVHVRPFLAVDLDRDQVLVHEGRGLLVLEGLMRHDVAPVTG